MKTIYLFRHGDTEDVESGFDYTRKLTVIGKLHNASMAEHLKSSGLRLDLIVSSGAMRALSTSVLIAEKYGYPEYDIVTEDILYSSDKPEAVKLFINKFPAEISSVMLVGHNPLLSDFVSYISSSPAGISMKKSSVVQIEFDTDNWNSIKSGSGRIVSYRIFDGSVIIDVVDRIH